MKITDNKSKQHKDNLTKYSFDSDLLRYLELDYNKKYTFNNIIQIIRKKIKTGKFKNSEIVTLFPSYECCACETCNVNMHHFARFIENNLIIQENKPDCYYYEFNQQPIELTSFLSI